MMVCIFWGKRLEHYVNIESKGSCTKRGNFIQEEISVLANYL